jgi:hypothetical protein
MVVGAHQGRPDTMTDHEYHESSMNIVVGAHQGRPDTMTDDEYR